MAGTPTGGKKSNLNAKKRLGTTKYKALKAKAGSAKTRGYFGKLKEEDPAKLREIIAQREARRKAVR